MLPYFLFLSFSNSPSPLCLIPLNLTLTQLQHHPQLLQCNEKLGKLCTTQSTQTGYKTKNGLLLKLPVKLGALLIFPVLLFSSVFSAAVFSPLFFPLLLLSVLIFLFPKTIPQSRAVCSHYPSAIFVVCLFEFVIRGDKVDLRGMSAVCLWK